jgi:hypothetical protein
MPLKTYGNGCKERCRAVVPRKQIAEGAAPPPTTPSESQAAVGTHDHSFTLQAVLQMQRAFGVVEQKVDRLIEDVGTHADKIDKVRHQVTFVKGALWVIGGLIVFVGALVAWYVTGKLSITFTQPPIK